MYLKLENSVSLLMGSMEVDFSSWRFQERLVNPIDLQNLIQSGHQKSMLLSDICISLSL